MKNKTPAFVFGCQYNDLSIIQKLGRQGTPVYACHLSNLCVDHQDLESGAFIFPESGDVFPFLKFIVIENTIQQEDSRYFYSMMEMSCDASPRTDKKPGLRVAGENCQVQLSGRNSLSIIPRIDKWETRVAFRNAGSKNFSLPFQEVTAK
ncbi:hypothetical protein RJ40_10445 [Methanofollis aquaemaris]|uniref:Uncharacterized protein n=1 Tax=Methanofollis aquaemaris TaxID=126734 RepID=A0A8A3S773_9EURY|nr:hypothetical protein [Methanofollis aquaemaris]QSZ67882.1 hypothetical protein RJ40_10445 [Methanofollis aquaemaris]